MIWRCDLVPQYAALQTEIDEAVSKVLRSGRYILGSEVRSFEQEFAAYVGTEHAVGVANGTDALSLSLMAYGIGEGDEVITTPFTAIPTLCAIMDTGARPVFVDVNPETFLMDIEMVPSRVTKRTRAIMPVHVFGNVVDVEALRHIVGPDMIIIEDACQSHGSTIRGRQSGSMGNAGAFSFYPTKNLGGYGDGGMVVTNDSRTAEKLRMLRMYGMTDYHHTIMHGINSRLDELQAAILRVKLKHLDESNGRRSTVAARYCAQLRPDRFAHQRIAPEANSNYHVFVSKYLGDRAGLIKYLDEQGIQTNIYYLLPLHLQESVRWLGYKRGDLPDVEALCDQVIALPMYPELRPDVQDEILVRINQFPNS